MRFKEHWQLRRYKYGFYISAIDQYFWRILILYSKQLTKLMLNLLKYIGRYELMIFNNGDVYQERFKSRFQAKKRFNEIISLSKTELESILNIV